MRLAGLPGIRRTSSEQREAACHQHYVAYILCMELADLPAGAERFDAKAMVLIENVTHHIEEEDQDWFPKVRTAPSGQRTGRDRLCLSRRGHPAIFAPAAGDRTADCPG
jgi:hypothetical protein